MKELSIVVPCFNKFNFTKSCLEDLSYLPNNHEIIVVDNGSSDETETQLKDSKEVVYVRLNENKGFGYAVNEGFSVATGKNLLTLNNDIKVRKNKDSWTNPIIEKCDQGLVGATLGILNKDLSFKKETNIFEESKYSYIVGWCLASSREIWDRLKLSEKDNHKEYFDERFFLYYEETDLAFRARELNINLVLVDIPVVHFGKQTAKHLNVREMYLKSKSIFEKKWKK
ncbi:MAG: glycosyltransferase [Chitinophagales bacterium]|nr:glycosyltransferase [Chitinophagales bacterium]